jgi:hypothetical protein
MKSFNESFGTVGLKSADPSSKHRTARRIFWSLLGTFMLVALLPAVPAAAQIHLAPVSSSTTYEAVTPTRLMDTRSSTKLGPGGTRNLTISGDGGGATAVVLNVTVTRTTAIGFLTVYPTGTTRPLASNLNWVAGKTIANLVEVKLGSGSQVTFYNSAGSTDVIADLEGYFAPTGGNFGGHVALTPARITDTRTGSGKPNAGSHLGPGVKLDIQVTGAGGVPSTGVSAVVLNFTVTNTTATSFLTVWPKGELRPTASNLNWVAGRTIANRVFVPVDPATGKVSVYNSAGSTDVIVDVSGYFTDASTPGAEFTPQIPVRLEDTRSSGTTLGAGSTLTLQVGGVAGVPTDASAVILNVTATNTTATSFLTVYPSTSSRPTASDLNWTAGVTIPNLVVATLGDDGAIKIYNPAGHADVLVDLFGYFQTPGPPPPPPSLVSALLNVGTKTITATWDQVVNCPAGSASDFTFADAYTGPGKASTDTSPVVASAVASVLSGGFGTTACIVTFGSEPANFGTNDFGTLTYSKPGSASIINAVNNANGFAPSNSVTAPDTSAPNLSAVSALVGSGILLVTYNEPVLCTSVVVGDYAVTLNGASDLVTGAACNGGSGGSSNLVNVTVSTAPTTTSDTWTLASHSVTDQSGQTEPGTQSRSGFAAGIRLTGMTWTATPITGGTGTITLTFSSPLDCTSVDIGDFTVTDITNQGGFDPVVLLTGVDSCSGSSAVYDYSIGNGGLFSSDTVQATAKSGSDGNTVLNSTDTQVEQVGDSLTIN